MTAAVLPFQQKEPKQDDPHCNCTISPESKEPPRKVWGAHGWQCSECGCLLMNASHDKEEVRS